MPSAIRVVTRVRDQDDFAGSLSDGQFLKYDLATDSFRLAAVTVPVQSVANSDGTLTVSPTTGAVVASLNLGHANTWTAQQTFGTSTPVFSTLTQGSVLYAGAGGLLSQDNANLFWDATNHRLSVGTNLLVNSGSIEVVGKSYFKSSGIANTMGISVLPQISSVQKIFTDYSGSGTVESDLAIGVYSKQTAIYVCGAGGGIGAAGYVGVNNSSSVGGQLHIVTSAAGTKGLIVQAAVSQSANLTEWQNSSGTALLQLTSAGDISRQDGTNLALRSSGNIDFYVSNTHRLRLSGAYLTAIGNASDLGQSGTPWGNLYALRGQFVNDTVGSVILAVKAAASQSANIFEAQKSDTTVYGTVSENGYFTTRKNTAPADAELASSEAAYWFDSTNGAAKFMVKAKTADGTVVTGQVALA